MMFNKLKEIAQATNQEKYYKGMELVKVNKKLGFEDKYLTLSLLFFFDEKEIKLKNEDLKNAFEKLNIIKEIIKNKEQFKSEYKKLIFSKINDIRIILALFSYYVYIITEAEKEIKLKNLEIIEEIILPLSHIMGINYYISQFEDFIIRTKYPKKYKDIINRAKKQLIRDKKEIDVLISTLKKYQKYPDEEIYGRIKSPYSVFKKVYVRKEPFENITDYVAIRIITHTVADCYSWMGHIFSLWQPIISKLKDYITNPKPNGYKSLHATVITKNGPVEFQVRTKKMHQFAEYGVAAHWRYKKYNDYGLSKELQKIDGFSFGKEKIFVYTPKKDIIILDKGATALDFAYAIHSTIGKKAIYAKINNQIKPLNTVLKEKDKIEILIDNHKSPSKEQLNYVITDKAKYEIKKELKRKKLKKYLKKAI